jgi:hypothetical protein
MRIGAELARFLEGPVMIILGSVDPAGRPEVGRAVGARVVAPQGRVDLVVSAWQWPGTVANLRATERLAATFSRPADYETYQLKGRAALRHADEDDLRLAEGYRTRTQAALEALGLSPGLADHWLAARDPVVLRLGVEEVFVQTPGPRAGAAMGART